MIRTALVFVLLLAALAQCSSEKRIDEVESWADYYVDNQTGRALRPLATEGGSFPVKLWVSEIPAKTKVHIYTFFEGTGGHVKPSNAFATFELQVASSKGSTKAYEGVRNEDWKLEGVSAKGHAIYVLVVK